MSRFERFRRKPGFRIALAFEAIFNTSVRELFSGDYHRVEKAICRRAKRLVKELAKESPDPLTAQKLAHLKQIITAVDGRT